MSADQECVPASGVSLWSILLAILGAIALVISFTWRKIASGFANLRSKMGG